MTRREFVMTAAATPFALRAAGARAPLVLFSKPVDKLPTAELASLVKKTGFDGLDLTVRKGGHVAPDRAGSDLPKAFEAFAAAGLSVPMITTEILNTADPNAQGILSTAGRLKIPYFKIGYHRYTEGVPFEQKLAEVKAALTGIAGLAKEYGVAAGVHNHSGAYFGTALWDTREVLKDLDPRWIGYYLDPGHATVEGGDYGWQLSMQVALTRLKMVAVKDFYWEKREGKWRTVWCPLGEGMVDWKKVFARLARANFAGPITLHVEYDPEDVPAAIGRDFVYLKKQMSA